MLEITPYFGGRPGVPNVTDRRFQRYEHRGWRGVDMVVNIAIYGGVADPQRRRRKLTIYDKSHDAGQK